MENNAQTNINTENNNGTQIDYKAEYEKAVAERDSFKAEAEKQKRMKDQYATENADYKKKAEAQMSDEERKAKELQEIIDRANNAEAELAQMRLRSDGLTNGFSADETDKLINGKFSFKDLADIVKARVDEAVKSAKAEMTKNNTAGSLLGKGSATDAEKSDFQKRQESRQKQSNIVEL